MSFNSWFKHADNLGFTVKEKAQARDYLAAAFKAGKKKQLFGCFVQTNDLVSRLPVSTLARMLDPLERAFTVGKNEASAK